MIYLNSNLKTGNKKGNSDGYKSHVLRQKSSKSSFFHFA